jgi:30S ribosomal protein S31
MGKGDIRTKKGKIVNGSFGKSRPHKEKKAADKTGKKAAPKKD